MITYNHEQFIAQALDSVLMQQVDFAYEIVVGEDCSTDSTREILREYQQKFPDKVRLLLPGKNLGMIRNMVETYNACRGDYIAILEGDDYWTSPHKLQKQVGFLDLHPECSACFHNVDVVHDQNPELDHLFHRNALKPFFDLRDVVSSHFIPTCSTMFRASLFPGFPAWYHEMPMGDWPLHVLNAEHGLIGYLDEILGAYRIHDGGIWSGVSRVAVLEKTIFAARTIDRHLGFRYRKELNRSIAIWEHEIACRMVEERKFRAALHYTCKAIKTSPFYFRVYRKTMSKVLMKMVFTGMFTAARGGKKDDQR